MNIKVKMKDGTIKDFREQGRSGGSWSNSFKCSEGWLIVTDEWESQTAIPSDLIAEVTTEQTRRSF